jgi:hypothetical protein
MGKDVSVLVRQTLFYFIVIAVLMVSGGLWLLNANGK